MFCLKPEEINLGADIIGILELCKTLLRMNLAKIYMDQPFNGWLLKWAKEIILQEDESYIHNYQAIGPTWFLKGKQKKIKIYGKHAGVGLFGILDCINGRLVRDPAEILNTQAFEIIATQKNIAHSPRWAFKSISQ